jgi:hypothetical protein
MQESIHQFRNEDRKEIASTVAENKGVKKKLNQKKHAFLSIGNLATLKVKNTNEILKGRIYDYDTEVKIIILSILFIAKINLFM